MPTEAIVLPILFISFFAVLGFWIYHRQQRQRELLRAQVELQTRILDRFASAQEFSGFLQTEGGQRFLSGLTHEGGWRPARRIITTVQTGLVITVLGCGIFALAGAAGQEEIRYPAIIVLFLGIGFLASALSSYLMSKRWGLLPGAPATPADDLTADL